MRLTIILIAATTLLAPMLSFGAGQPPNIILILADDQGYTDLGCFGSSNIRTPRLDRMAAEGMRFTDFYAPAPVCTPTRAGIMTGCYATRVGLGEIPNVPGGKGWMRRVLYRDAPYGLNPDEITVAELLKTRGYATGCIGKWHLGDVEPFLPINHGFDEYFGILYSNDMPPVDFVRGKEIVEKGIDQSTIVDRYTDESMKFIRAHKDGPFFLYLAHTMPHVPLAAPERFRGKSQRGLYGDIIESIDESTGEILDLLTELKIDENTLIVYTSDNGPWLSKGEHGGSANGLRGGKGGTYEGGMRVPAIMRWPGTIPLGAVCREVGAHIDFLPTFAALAGAEVPTDRVIDGKDVGDLLRGKADAKSPHDAFFYYSGDKLNAVRSGRWKLKLPTTLAEEFSGYLTLKNPDTEIPEALFDLELDPGEQKSVLKEHPDIAERLRAMVEAAREDIGDSRLQKVGQNVRPIGELPGWREKRKATTVP